MRCVLLDLFKFSELNYIIKNHRKQQQSRIRPGRLSSTGSVLKQPFAAFFKMGQNKRLCIVLCLEAAALSFFDFGRVSVEISVLQEKSPNLSVEASCVRVTWFRG